MIANRVYLLPSSAGAWLAARLSISYRHVVVLDDPTAPTKNRTLESETINLRHVGVGVKSSFIFPLRA
jgi:hypothetical protein